MLPYFGVGGGTGALSSNGGKHGKEEVGDENNLGRGLAARLNSMSQDCPDLQFPIKPCSREMVKPKRGLWRSLKKVARYLMNRGRFVWEFNWVI